jgi:hypothetical protein
MTLLSIMEGADLEESGPLTAMLDRLAVEGVAATEGRAFATWLELAFESLRAERDDWKEQYKDLKDQHPDQLPVTAAGFYHVKKEGAQAVLAQLLTDPRVADGMVQLEPGNGWMVVVVPKPADLADLAHLAEVQDGQRRPAPTGKVKPFRTAPDSAVKGPSGAKAGGGEGTAPVKGATALVWSIADRVVKDMGKVDRAAIITACTAQGINAATAGTQYSKWKRAKGY